MTTNGCTMPVHLETHTPEIDLTPGTTKSDVVFFLYNNPEFGYRPSEIKEELDIPRGTATTTVKRLHESGYIGKTEDSYYYALENREDICRYVASLDQLDRLFGHHTEEGANSAPASLTTQPDRDIDEDDVETELSELEDEITDSNG